MAEHENPDLPDTSTPDPQSSDSDTTVDQIAPDAPEDGAEEPKQKLQLDVTIESRSACERHLTVTVARDDINRYFDTEFSELMPKAQVPGFRPGRAPRKLIEARFRKDVGERVKMNLLMDSLGQIHEEHDLSAISEPDLDLEAVEIPESGPMTFEFDLEVRPEFDLPDWKGMKLEKPVRQIDASDIDRTLERILASRGRLVPCESPAKLGDYITCNLTFKLDSMVLSEAHEEVIRIRPILSFRDGRIEQFDKLMEGAAAGETRTGSALISPDAPNETLRGQSVTAEFQVLEVKRLELPELNEDLLEELGGFELEADLRDAVKEQLEQQLLYEQRRRTREQITRQLTISATWELPPEMLKRQASRELERAVMELQSAGFSEEEIRARQNQIRQNAMAETARALKEHFILERIAEAEEIEADEADYDQEIALIAANRGDSPRRVRARLEKSGSMDVLRNQIIERKVIERILEHATFTEVPFEFEVNDVEAIDESAGGHGAEIPHAKPGAEAGAPGGRPGELPHRE
ncbi:MAG: trigger factor [Thermoguttaceae bacterium]|jgi:trigger factor|nr:trigger factor [Thermoguttaceae bacterium]